jgi:hypothetical protein
MAAVPVTVAMAVTTTTSEIQTDARAIVARSIPVVAVIGVIASHRAAAIPAPVLIPAPTISHLLRG